MMTAIRKVLIVGGGIGGLTLAAALGQWGIKAKIVEIKPETTAYGVGILQPGNALRALRTLGVMEACFAAGFQMDEYRVCDAQGGLIASMNLLRVADPDLPAINALPRRSLHRILTDAALAVGAEIQFQKTIVGLTEKGFGIEARMSDGSVEIYDLIVGADGIRSSVRKILFGEQYEPQFTGQGVWRFTTARPAALDYQAMYFGVGVKAGLVPITKELMYLFLVTNEPDNPWMPADRLHIILADHLKDFSGEFLPTVRDNLKDPKDVIYVPIEEVSVPSPWYRGRVVLIGDAAHASSPHIAQGASMAIEDAIVLSELAAIDQPVAQTLDQFMKRRYDRCRFVQNTSRQVGLSGNLEDERACRERNEWMRKEFASPQPRPHELQMAAPI
jgi:2-polyprenyl-6-methoxyphenol hydroxylase-like FAD-dependent oxidoreductase